MEAAFAARMFGHKPCNQPPVRPRGGRHLAWFSVIALLLAAPRYAQPAFLPPVNLSGDNDAYCASVAMDKRGDAIVAWVESAGGGVWEVHAAFRPRRGSFEPAEMLGLLGDIYDCYAEGPRIAFDTKGNALVVWQGDDFAIKAAFRPKDAVGGFASYPQNPITIPGSADGIHPRVAFGFKGSAIVGWVAAVEQRFRASFRPNKDGIFGLPETVSVNAL